MTFCSDDKHVYLFGFDNMGKSYVICCIGTTTSNRIKQQPLWLKLSGSHTQLSFTYFFGMYSSINESFIWVLFWHKYENNSAQMGSCKRLLSIYFDELWMCPVA